jgi:Zn-dependent protease/CBS domain-containing protein
MFGTRWRLFRLLGIPIYVDASWLIIFALLTLSLANFFPGLMQEYFPAVAPALAPSTYWVMGMLAALAFFACILLHELGHALVARSQHMPIRGITLFLFGGVAEIEEEPPSAKAELLVAVAGPAVSVFLAIVLGLLGWVGDGAQWPAPLILVLAYLAIVNAVVLAFNLVPAFPLDGGRVFRALLWAALGNLRRATYTASLVGRGFAWVLVLWGLLNLFAGNGFGGAWMCLIGFFLHNAAQASYQQVLVRQALAGEPVRRFMTPEPIVVSPGLGLREWVEDVVYPSRRKAFPVVFGGRLEGIVDTDALAQVPRSEWDRHRVAEVMRRDLTGLVIEPDTDALEALGRMQRTGSSRLLVTEGDQLVGILSSSDLMRFLTLKLELEGEAEDKARESRFGSPRSVPPVSQRPTRVGP